MMPGEDGLSLARYIRQRSDIPIIMLTGKGDLIDRVVGLEAGADDYITKPFELREVLARIRTVMRRAGPRPRRPRCRPAAAGAAKDEILVFQGWRLDVVRRELTRPTGEMVPLTAGEFDLLCAFARHPNRVLGRKQLIELVKGRDWAAYDRAIDTQVGRLRKKLEPDPANPSSGQDGPRGRLYLRQCRQGGLSRRRRSAIQQLAELGLQLVDAVGLAEPAGFREGQPTLADRRLGIAGGEQDLQFGAASAGLLRQIDARHPAGHHDVGEEQVERLARGRGPGARPARCPLRSRHSRAP